MLLSAGFQDIDIHRTAWYISYLGVKDCNHLVLCRADDIGFLPRMSLVVARLKIVALSREIIVIIVTLVEDKGLLTVVVFVVIGLVDYGCFVFDILSLISHATPARFAPQHLGNLLLAEFVVIKPTLPIGGDV